MKDTGVNNLNIDSLFAEVSPAETETAWGGWDLFGFPYPAIITIHGDVNSISNTYEGLVSMIIRSTLSTLLGQHISIFGS